jgi:hypothetical protein
MDETTPQYSVVDGEQDIFEINPVTTKLNNIKNIVDENAKPFGEIVKDFLVDKSLCVYILTPCFGSVCYVNYVQCLIATRDLLNTFGIKVRLEFCKNDSLVSRARNNLVAKAMANPETTHILFIDNDITWDPVDVLRLIISDKQLLGGVYPLKHYDWSKLLVDEGNPYNSNIVQSWLNKKNQSEFKDVISDEKLIQHKLLKYNINYLGNVLSIEHNLAKVKHLATGFMMFKRDVVEKMSKAFPSTKYTDDVYFLEPHENEFAYALFDCGVEDDHYFSEDWLFCHRWQKMGGEVWIDVSIMLTHTGIEDYSGSFISAIL